jgi:acyl-CoA reductase-like NAD-dependent aldehyde dehydrogenase
MKIGDPLDPTTTVGATITKEHADKVLSYVDSAVQEGAKVACGGKRVVLEGRSQTLS